MNRSLVLLTPYLATACLLGLSELGSQVFRLLIRQPEACRFLLLLSALFLACSSPAAPASDDYLLRLQNRITGQARSNVAVISKLAGPASTRFVAGGSLWVAGRQPDFIAEACGRAGGLMTIAPLGQQRPGTNDTILYAVPGALNREDLGRIDNWRRQGAFVVVFGSTAGLYRELFPIDTVANVMDLWTWTGEFVAACTRLGKMPVLYQSYGLPGGPERGKKYEGKKFHDDLTVSPVPSGVLAHEYLSRIERMLARIHESQMPKLIQAGQWSRQAKSARILVTGHMFPRHAQDPRTTAVNDVVAVPAWEDKDLLDASRLPDFVLYLGYQFAPRKLLEQAKANGLKLVYTDVEPAQPPQPGPNILYIDPGWPLPDACVNVPGYDIPILPASGVIQAAIYWTIASEGTPGE